LVPVVNEVTWEIQTDPGVWLDISPDVYQRDPFTITRGRPDEASDSQAGYMQFTLANRSGKYSPRNPLSPLFGKIHRNTPIRCTIDNGAFTRFNGEISDLPPIWDESHVDNRVPIQAYGVMRRYGQGQPQISNALRDWIEAQAANIPNLWAYYPMIGGQEKTYSQNLAPGKTGSFYGSKNAIFEYGVDMGAAWIGTGLLINATGDIPYLQGDANAIGTNVALDFVFQSFGFGVLDVQLWPGFDEIYQLRMNTSVNGFTMQVSHNDGQGGIDNALPSSAIPELNDAELHTCRFELDSSGGFVSFFVYIDGVLVYTVNGFEALNITHFPFFRFHYSRFTDQTYVNVAHVALWADNTAANIPTAADYAAAAFAYAGETAIDRLVRICADGDIPLVTSGVAAESMPMGPQFTDTRLDQIREVEATDLGILLEQRDAPGLLYLSRTSLYNQTPAFTLDYGAQQVSAPLLSNDDDQFTRNDVTATRREAGSDQYTVDDGPLGTPDPPTGVGRYATEITVNPETDGYLDGIAAWTANIGTLDVTRWPNVTVNLNNPSVPTALRNLIKAADVGDVFTITKMQKAFIYDDVSLLIIGYSETITPFVHTITFNCMPADIYTVGVWSTSASSGTFRWDTGGSTVNTLATATATSLSVATTSGNVIWTTDSNAFPFDIKVAGERMTVTNITGASSPQTFTVVRSVNGVVKAQPVGGDVRLFNTPRWAL
jgi:hypothetical protein